MKSGNNLAEVRSKLVGRAALLACLVMLLFPPAVRAQADAAPKRVLVLYWYNKDHSWNVSFDRSLKDALQSARAGPFEYYPEYLESNRFPGERQSLLLRDYLRQKYVDRIIDVVVATSGASLDFILKYRADLFPRTPIVFVATGLPTAEQLAAGPGLTGLIVLTDHRQTVDLALRLHPDTKHIFIVSGTLEHDKRLETLAREQLQGYDSKVEISYLTDLRPEELIEKTKRLPEKSLVLYVWQQSRGAQGRVLETEEVLASFARSVRVPIYGMSTPYIGAGAVGGYISTPEAIGARAGEIVTQVAGGARPQDIPVENAPTVPIFDWREFKRWGISEDRLPPGSVVLFREQGFWELYRWRIIAIVALLVAQTLIIARLLVQRSRLAQAEMSRRMSEENLRKLSGRLIHLQDEERRRIAAELHDGLGQCLVVIKNRAAICLRDTADSHRVTEQLEEISSTATSAIDEVHEIAHNLRPYELDRLGLVKAVETMVAKLTNSSSFRLSVDLDRIDGLLSPAAETSVYRIIQEGLNNVIKHAESTEARVSVKQVDHRLVITVADNGKGIKTHHGEAGQGGGFGLAGIAERARMLGGSSVLESRPEGGTTLIVTLGLSEVRNGRQT